METSVVGRTATAGRLVGVGLVAGFVLQAAGVFAQFLTRPVDLPGYRLVIAAVRALGSLDVLTQHSALMELGVLLIVTGACIAWMVIASGYAVWKYFARNAAATTAVALPALVIMTAFGWAVFRLASAGEAGRTIFGMLHFATSGGGGVEAGSGAYLFGAGVALAMVCTNLHYRIGRLGGAK